MKPDLKRVRAAIIQQLRRQPMTIAELADELDFIAPANVIRNQVEHLVRGNIATGIESSEHNVAARYELWETAIARIKSRATPAPRGLRRDRPARRVA